MTTLKATSEMQMRHNLIKAQKAYQKVKVANSNVINILGTHQGLFMAIIVKDADNEFVNIDPHIGKHGDIILPFSSEQYLSMNALEAKKLASKLLKLIQECKLEL